MALLRQSDGVEIKIQPAQAQPAMNKLNDSHFSFKCPMSFEGMTPSENGRFCDRCRKEVFDLTDCSVEEVVALQKKHGSLCGSNRVVQTAAVVALSLSATACPDGSPADHVPRPSGARAGMSLGMICYPLNSLFKGEKN